MNQLSDLLMIQENKQLIGLWLLVNDLQVAFNNSAIELDYSLTEIPLKVYWVLHNVVRSKKSSKNLSLTIWWPKYSYFTIYQLIRINQ